MAHLYIVKNTAELKALLDNAMGKKKVAVFIKEPCAGMFKMLADTIPSLRAMTELSLKFPPAQALPFHKKSVRNEFYRVLSAVSTHGGVQVLRATAPAVPFQHRTELLRLVACGADAVSDLEIDTRVLTSEGLCFLAQELIFALRRRYSLMRLTLLNCYIDDASARVIGRLVRQDRLHSFGICGALYNGATTDGILSAVAACKYLRRLEYGIPTSVNGYTLAHLAAVAAAPGLEELIFRSSWHIAHPGDGVASIIRAACLNPSMTQLTVGCELNRSSIDAMIEYVPASALRLLRISTKCYFSVDLELLPTFPLLMRAVSRGRVGSVEWMQSPMHTTPECLAMLDDSSVSSFTSYPVGGVAVTAVYNWLEPRRLRARRARAAADGLLWLLRGAGSEPDTLAAPLLTSENDLLWELLAR